MMNTSRLPVSTCFALETAACTIACWITRSNPTVGSGSTEVVAGTGVNAFASTSSTCLRSASTFTPQVASNARACGSSVIARSRCSRPTVSWRRSVASRNARWIVSNVSGANGTGGLLMYALLRLLGCRVWFHCHQQREFVLLGQLPGGLHLCFGYIVRIDAGQPHPG